MPRTLLLLAALAAPSSVLVQPQPHPLVGTWNITMETPMPPSSGGPATIDRKGVLAVNQAGDSLVATLTFDDVRGIPPRPPERLAAVARPGVMSFVKTVEASLSAASRGDLASTATITYTFEVREATVVGSMRISMAEVPNIPARDIVGTRARPRG
jgi:hypothetical protein